MNYAPLVLLVITISVIGCKKINYPVEHSLKDSKSGEPIPVSITGRTTTHVEFIRLKDSKFFSYPIAKLSIGDKKFVKTLPLVKTPNETVPAINKTKNKPAYIQTRLERIAKLEEDIPRLELEIKGETGNTGMIKLHTRQISEKKFEIQELRQDIERYHADH